MTLEQAPENRSLNDSMTVREYSCLAECLATQDLLPQKGEYLSRDGDDNMVLFYLSDGSTCWFRDGATRIFWNKR